MKRFLIDLYWRHGGVLWFVVLVALLAGCIGLLVWAYIYGQMHYAPWSEYTLSPYCSDGKFKCRTTSSFAGKTLVSTTRCRECPHDDARTAK